MRGQRCSETRGQEKAATEDRGKKGTEERRQDKSWSAPVVEDTDQSTWSRSRVPGVAVVAEY